VILAAYGESMYVRQNSHRLKGRESNTRRARSKNDVVAGGDYPDHPRADRRLALGFSMGARVKGDGYGSRVSVMRQARGLATALLSVLASGVLVGCRSSLIAEWRADRTARRLIRALHERDSVALTALSASGSAQNWLCVQRHWPPAFWTRDSGEPELEQMTSSQGSFHYRIVGDPLPRDSTRAVLEFDIGLDRPEKVQRFFVNSRTGVWTPAVESCLRRDTVGPG